MSDFLLYEKTGGIVVLTINRPEQRNALSTIEICEEFEDRCKSIERDPSVNVLILTGAGPAFCAGGDIKKMRDRSGFAPAKTIIDTRDSYRGSIHRIPKALYNLEVPTIAAVNGAAIGAGLDLACMCDMRIASEKAVFAESFIKLGIVPGDGGAWFLPRMVGYSMACEMAFTGMQVGAEEALKMGLISRVVEEGALLEAAFELANRIDAMPGRTLRLTKRLLRDSAQLTLDTHLEMAGAFQSIAHETEDHREAIDAMFEKRAPIFKSVRHMIKDYDALMGMTPVVMEQRYSHKDSCLYALSVGCGLDPADDWMRRYLGPLPPARTLPGMATVLAAPRLHAIGLGVTLSGVLHGSQGLIAYAALPTEGHVRSESRVASVFDRGDGRGCLINMVRELRDVDAGTHYASLQMTFICRSDQVAGAPPVEKAASDVEPEREPDIVVQVPTSTQAAQLFALTGDQNPLHMVPDVAAKAGFPRPILHGVATYGLCAAFAEKALCMDAVEASGRRLGAISGRFNAPVFPGETIELALWREAAGARIEARVPVRGKVVFAAGRIAIEEDC